MIYTVTFNPAIDYVVHMDKMQFGLTNRSKSEEYYFGGKGINVSTVLTNLGFENKALGFVAGFTGETIEEGIKKIGIKTDFIHLKKGISRINIKIKDTEETEINCQGPDISQEEINSLYEKTDLIKDGDTLVLAGSIPDSLPKDIYENIMERLKDKDIKFVVDATKNLLLNVLKYHPFLIKPNNYELGEMFGVEIAKDDDEKIIKYAKELQKMGAINVLVSLAGNGSILVDENGNSHKMGVAPVKVVNSVGAGDSMVAGFIAGYQQTQDYGYALRLGTACGGATANSKGLATKEKVDKLLNLI
ncbi:MAG: 1-phosphofructokinase [Ruminococcus sp.]|nr:1-phosphofructokinase [Ruminococcus sp.]